MRWMNGSVDRLAYTCILSIETHGPPFSGLRPTRPAAPSRSRNEFMQDPMSDMPSRLVSGTPPFGGSISPCSRPAFRRSCHPLCVQPLLPEFSREFHVSAAVSSLSLSLSTGLLAVAMLVAGSLSEVLGPQAGHGRFPVRLGAPHHPLRRGAQLDQPAPDPHADRDHLERPSRVAMAYVSEEVDSKSIGLAMGLFIGGNAIGGMAGRIIGGVLTDLRVLASLRWDLSGSSGWSRRLPPGAASRPRCISTRAGPIRRRCCAPSACTCGTPVCAPCSRRPSFSWAPS